MYYAYIFYADAAKTYLKQRGTSFHPEGSETMSGSQFGHFSTKSVPPERSFSPVLMTLFQITISSFIIINDINSCENAESAYFLVYKFLFIYFNFLVVCNNCIVFSAF